MTGDRFLKSCERRLNLDFTNATDQDWEQFLGIVNDEKDEIAKTIATRVNEKYLTVESSVGITRFEDSPIATMSLPTDSIGGIHYIGILESDGTLRKINNELPYEPNVIGDQQEDNPIVEGMAYYFDKESVRLVGIDPDITTGFFGYDRYPINITRGDLIDNTQDLSISIGLPRASHTALLRKVIAEYMLSDDASYRANIITLAVQKAEEAERLMVDSMKGRNKQRNIIPAPRPRIR